MPDTAQKTLDVPSSDYPVTVNSAHVLQWSDLGDEP
jgi:hypothetical protein